MTAAILQASDCRRVPARGLLLVVRVWLLLITTCAALLLAGFAVMMMSLPSMGSRIQWLWLQGLQQVNQLLGIA
jgi:hypothetical protein